MVRLWREIDRYRVKIVTLTLMIFLILSPYHQPVVALCIYWTTSSHFLLDKHRRTALHVACRQGHEEIVRYLLEDANPKANPNARDKDEATPLIHAIQVSGICMMEVFVFLVKKK